LLQLQLQRAQERADIKEQRFCIKFCFKTGANATENIKYWEQFMESRKLQEHQFLVETTNQPHICTLQFLDYGATCNTSLVN
jgi:hypothetical protein